MTDNLTAAAAAFVAAGAHDAHVALLARVAKLDRVGIARALAWVIVAHPDVAGDALTEAEQHQARKADA